MFQLQSNFPDCPWSVELDGYNGDGVSWNECRTSAFNDAASVLAVLATDSAYSAPGLHL